MRRPLRLAAWALAGLLAAGLGVVGTLIARHPSLDPYRSLALPEAAPTSKVRVRFAGVSTLVFDDGETTWMTDGFFTRPSKLATLTSRIESDPEAVERGLHQLGVTRLAAVVPQHAHYDHAMDAPRVAQRTGALLIGDASVLNIGRGFGLADARMLEVKSNDVVELGRFKLRFIASRHSPTPYSSGHDVEPITAPLKPPARATAWREGEVWSLLVEHDSGTRMLVQASAGFVPGALAGQRADTVFLGVGTLGRKDDAYREAYWREVVRAVGARRVVPIHWDDFWRPLDEPMLAMPLLLDDFATTMTALQRSGERDGVEIRMAPLFTPFEP